MNYWDAQQLVGAALGLTEEAFEKIIDEDESQLDDLLFEKFEVDFDQFMKIATALLNLTPLVESAITKELHHAFVRRDKHGYIAIVQQDPVSL